MLRKCRKGNDVARADETTPETIVESGVEADARLGDNSGEELVAYSRQVLLCEVADTTQVDALRGGLRGKTCQPIIVRVKRAEVFADCINSNLHLNTTRSLLRRVPLRNLRLALAHLLFVFRGLRDNDAHGDRANEDAVPFFLG